MRSRRKLALFAAFVVLIGAIFFSLARGNRSSISVTQVTYRKLLGGRLMVDFEVVNSGKTSIPFHVWDNLMLRTEGAEGWTNAPVIARAMSKVRRRRSS